MKSIYKYRLDPADQTILTLRGDVLSAGVQGDDIMVWAVHDDAAPERKVRVNVMGTGHLVRQRRRISLRWNGVSRAAGVPRLRHGRSNVKERAQGCGPRRTRQSPKWGR